MRVCSKKQQMLVLKLVNPDEIKLKIINNTVEKADTQQCIYVHVKDVEGVWSYSLLLGRKITDFSSSEV